MLGLASLPLQFIVEDRRAVLNALEWWYALLMVGTYALMGRVWQRQGWRLQLLHCPPAGAAVTPAVPGQLAASGDAA